MIGPATPRARSGESPERLLIGLIGSGIQSSLTPAMQMREAAEHNLLMHYQLIDLERLANPIEALPALVRSLRLIRFNGFNVTFPCKQAILPLLDDLSDDARAISAVNTVVRDGERLIGYNTDCSGWRWGMQQSLPDSDLSHVVLLGAGGAGSAIGEALMSMPCRRLTIVDTERARAEALAQALDRRYPGRVHSEGTAALGRLMDQASGLVHATPTGMAKHPGLPIAAEVLQSHHWVSEVVYFPMETELLQLARARGCRVCHGGEMAVGQALGAFSLFTGLTADPMRVRKHFSSLLAV